MKRGEITIKLIGDTFKVFLETRKFLKEILGLEEDPPPALVIAMLFQYGQAPFKNLKEGFGEVHYVNNVKNLEKVGHLVTMIHNDWNFFTGKTSTQSTLQ